MPGPMWVATDGGADGDSDTRVASWGVAVAGAMPIHSGSVPGIDQSSTAAELWALVQLVTALHADREKHPDEQPFSVIVLIDNKSVQRQADAIFDNLERSHAQAWALWRRFVISHAA